MKSLLDDTSPLKRHNHPNFDYPETFAVWTANGRNSVFGVSRLYRPRVGLNGADLFHNVQTNE